MLSTRVVTARPNARASIDKNARRSTSRRRASVPSVARATPSPREDDDVHTRADERAGVAARSHAAARGVQRRRVLASIAAGVLSSYTPADARAALSLAPPVAGGAAAGRARPIYFGNGCFWGRQHTFYEAELSLGRTDDTITSVVGYAGGASVRPEDSPVCYYYGPSETVYERLGHCEVVAVDAADEKELRVLADAYFASFQKIPGLGMQRVDPQDAGPGYRNCVALPGGVDSPLFPAIQAANVNGMKLVPGTGNNMKPKPSETDIINTVWIYDSDRLPFFPAEVYHQFHDGLGYKFPVAYTRDLKASALERGLIAPTGCPEMRERSFADFVSFSA